MALITDPDQLNYELASTGTKELFIDLANKKIKLVRVGNLSSDGVTIKALYSKIKEVWKDDTTAIRYPFPFTPITDEQFELKDGWNLDKTGTGSDYTPNLIRTGGWAVKNASGVTTEMWAGIMTLGTIQAGGQAYYAQSSIDSAHNFNLTGAVNQAVQIYSDPNADGNPADGFDYRAYMRLFLREQGNTFAASQLSDIGVSALTYQAYRFPLADGDDTKISVADTGIDANSDGTPDVAPYSGMSITWFAAAQARTINGVSRNFHVIIDGNSGTAEQIYAYVQWALRRNADIDAGAGSKIGKLTNELLYFVGSDLYTKLDSTGGVYIDNYQAGDTNRVHFTDDTGTIRNNARTGALTINFGENLVADADAIFRVFFTNDDAGNNAGADYGTASAITVNDASGTPITGTVSAASSIQKTYDIDNNVQRGAASAGTDVPITAVAIGLSTGQFVAATGVISATTLSGTVSLVAALERQYLNP